MPVDLKFLIITNQDINIQDIINSIIESDDNYIIGKRFINDVSYKDTENIDRLYYLDNSKISQALKNNSIFYILCENNKTVGMTIDDFYNADICQMNLKEFNSISTNLLLKYKDDIVIVWLDTNKHTDQQQLTQDIREVNYLCEKIDKFNYLYFLNETPQDIAKTIIEFDIASNEDRQKTLEEYS